MYTMCNVTTVYTVGLDESASHHHHHHIIQFYFIFKLKIIKTRLCVLQIYYVSVQLYFNS